MTRFDKTPAASASTNMPMHHGVMLQLFWGLILVYGTCYLPLLAVFKVAETLLVLLFFWVIFARKDLRAVIFRDPFFRILLVLLAYLLASMAWHTFTLPDGMDPSFRFNRYYLKPFMALVAALGIALGSVKRSWTLLLVSLLGLLLYLAFFTQASEWVSAWTGTRTDFGIHNAQHSGMLFGICLLALVFFAPRSVRAGKKKMKPVVVIGAVALILFALFGALVSQTRAVWLGLFAAFVSTCLLLPYIWQRSQKRLTRRRDPLFLGLGILTLIAVLTFGFASFNADNIIEKRLASENISIEKLEEAGSLKHSPAFTSISIRVASWAAGLTWFAERPWLGWGGGTTDDLIDRSSFFSGAFKRSFGHLHNSYMEVLVSHGTFGAILMLALMIWLGLSTFRAFHQGKMPVDVFLFACAFFVFWFVINTFESYVLFASGHYSNAIIGGFIYSFYLRAQINE